MEPLNKTGKVKFNHKKGIADQSRQRKRSEAESRNKAYQALTLEQKLARNSTKVRHKLNLLGTKG
jgi:hypothetical protein